MGGVAWPERTLAQPQPWADLPSRKYKRQEGATPTPASGGRRRWPEPPSRRAKPETKPPPWGLRVLGRGRKPQGPRAGNRSPALPHGHLTALAPRLGPAPPRRKMVTQRPHHPAPCAAPAQPRQPPLGERKPLLVTRQRGSPSTSSSPVFHPCLSPTPSPATTLVAD